MRPAVRLARSLRPRAVVLASLAACAAAVDACAQRRSESQPHDALDASAALDGALGSADDAKGPAVRAASDAGRGNIVKLGAAAFAVSVTDMPAWPESGTGSRRLGYLRHGAVVEGYDRPLVNDDCKDGWLTLVGGGWVCGKSVTTELSSPRVRLAPRQADRDAGMPYRYGVNLVDGTPLYRRVLGADDRKKYEAPARTVKDDESSTATAPASATPTSEDVGERAEVVAEDDRSTGGSEPASTPATPAARSSARAAASAVDAGSERGKPRLRDLRGRGVLVRKMARGFYLALDRDFKAAGARWWRTSYGFAAPFERIMLQGGVTKHRGTWFEGTPFAEALEGDDADGGALTAALGDGGAPTAPSSLAGAVGFVMHGGVHQLLPNEERTKVGWGPELPKRSAVLLTGRVFKVDGAPFHEAAGGFWVRLGDLKLARPAPPADLAPGEKWIDVDLTRQALVAFEGTRPVFATLISSGRRNLVDKEKDFPTPTGTFTIREKHVSTTMDGDVASDGPYSIEDVPWVMYFQGSYALHGAFWHDQFGNVRSHGCVNMSPEDARTLFAWSDPPLPDAWHGVFAKSDKEGSRVVVHEDKPPKRGASR